MIFTKNFSLNGTLYKEGSDASSLDKHVLKVLKQRGVVKQKAESTAVPDKKQKTKNQE